METLEAAKNKLLILSRTTSRYTPEDLAKEDTKIREAFEKAGTPIIKHSKLDRDIRYAVRRAHINSEADKRKELQHLAASGRVDHRYIETLDAEIRQHCKGYGREIRWGSMYELMLNELVRNAHRTCGENLLKQYCEDAAEQDAYLIPHKIMQVVKHFEAIDEPILDGTERYRKIWDAVCTMCSVSNLNPREMQDVFKKTEDWLSQLDEDRRAKADVEIIGKTEIAIPPDYQDYPTRKAAAEREEKAAAAPDVAKIWRMYKLPYRPSKSYKWMRVAQRNERLTVWRKRELRLIQDHKL